MVVYDLLLLDNNVYSKIAVIGNKDVYNYLNTKVDKEWVEIDFIEDFKDYTKNPRVYHRVINGLENVDYEKIYNSIHHQGWLVVLPEIYDYDLKQKLEDINFVAINETDKHITAKRMHGWGNK
jgi:uncharacterized protein YcgL (UPF0745 family)